jgi:hypothetical protein
MRLISPEEKAAMVMAPRHNEKGLRTTLLQMQVEEIILIEEHEWTWKSAQPNALCRRVEAKTGRKFECEKVVSPGSGWVITRVR